MKMRLLLLLCIGLMVCALPPAGALPASHNVVFIGGSALSTSSSDYVAANAFGWTGGGWLPITGTGLDTYVFSAMDPSAVSTASLAPYDTAVLMVSSWAMRGDTDTLTDDQMEDLVSWVALGNKLIIYDSECDESVDYSWLPYPFTTANPGAQGAPGTLTVLDDNPLASYKPTSPYFIDAAFIGPHTDAVGDMNVMVTQDPHWFVNMTGTNALNISGPVHTYADYPANTDRGLIIYNGLDQDPQYYGEANMRKIWIQELGAPFNPSGLNPNVSAVGITLTPTSGSGVIRTFHTATVTLKNLLGVPQAGRAVHIWIDAGPNAGLSATGVSDANGVMTFTYQSNGIVGQDTIKASFVNLQGVPVEAAPAVMTWNLPPGPQPTNILYPVLGGKGLVFTLYPGDKNDAGADWPRFFSPKVDPNTGQPVVDPFDGQPAYTRNWDYYVPNANGSDVRQVPVVVQSVTLEKIIPVRKSAGDTTPWPTTGFVQKLDGTQIVTQTEYPGKISDLICGEWPLLYEVDGTEFRLTIRYSTDIRVADKVGGAPSKIHAVVYHWYVDSHEVEMVNGKIVSLTSLNERLAAFRHLPFSTNEVVAVTFNAQKKLNTFINGFGSMALQNWVPGFIYLANSGNRSAALNKLTAAEAYIDSVSARNGWYSSAIYAFNNDTPCPTPGDGEAIVENSTRPAASMLINDLWAVLASPDVKTLIEK